MADGGAAAWPMEAIGRLQDQGKLAVKPTEEATPRRRSGSTPSKAVAMATRSCLRAMLSTSADGNPCATVMPLLSTAPAAVSRPDPGLRIVCAAESSLVDGSTVEDAASSALPTHATHSRSLSAASSRAPSAPCGSPPGELASSDVFLHASIQLAHVQSDAHARVRQLWHTVQRLRWEGQLSDAAVDALHKELLALAKSASAEKLDGAKVAKTGYLRLVQAPLSAAAALKQQSVKALFGAGERKPPQGQLVWCALSEDHARLEVSPVRESGGASAAPPPGTSPGKPTLADSLKGLWSDAFHNSGQATGGKKTLIRLHGCHVRTVSAGAGDDAVDEALETCRRFQILVPHCDAVGQANGSPPHAARVPSFDIYVFEAVADPATSTSAGDGVGSSLGMSSWVRAIDRVCMFHLYKLEERVRAVDTAAAYRDVIARSFPLTIPLTWLRNRQDRAGLRAVGEDGHHEEEQRRASRNLSMAQVIKDLERDRVLLDQRLLCPSDSQSALDSGATLDTVSEIFKHLVTKVMASSTSSTESVGGPRTAPSSPSRRFVGFSEAKAVAFVERVLRGCSRTQSGGDIYDAISFLCQHQRVSICPLSQEACPVQISTQAESGDGLRVEVKVRMSFKVVELTPTTPTSSRAARRSELDGARGEVPSESDSLLRQRRGSAQRRHSLQHRDSLREWAVIEGTLVRYFTPGRASTPGCVMIDFAQCETS